MRPELCDAKSSSFLMPRHQQSVLSLEVESNWPADSMRRLLLSLLLFYYIIILAIRWRGSVGGLP